MEKASILIVEDEAVVALDLQMQLEDLGYLVVGTAESSEEAIALAKRHHPHLVLMDVMLKGAIDGIDTADILKRHMEVPVIFLTSFSDTVTVQRAAKTAAHGYLTKPFQFKELRAGIEIALCKSRMERQLRESERWFASTLRCVQDSVIVVEPDGRIRFLNPAAEDLLGCSMEEAEGEHVATVVQFADAPGGLTPLTTLQKALQDTRTVSMAHGRTLLTAEGAHVAVDESSAPILDTDGTPLGAVMALRDVTQRVQQETRLRASEERFRSAFAHAPLGMALVSLDGTFLQVNDALCQLLGCTPEWLRQQRHDAMSDPADLEHEQHRLRSLLGAEPVVQFEKRYLHSRDAHPVPTLVSASLMREGLEPTCYLYQVHDLTAQKKAAEELAQFTVERMSHQAAEIASRSKSEFLSRMSHEMRTPLNAILGFAQLLHLQGESGAQNTAAFSQHILQAGQHLLALVDDVLDLQRVAAGRMKLSMESLSLGECVALTQTLLLPAADSQEIRFEGDVPTHIKVQADVTRLRQVLLNIGSNAIKYNVPQGHVAWQVRQLDNGKVRLTIGDTGQGMNPEQLGKLFEPFERLGMETSGIPGTGLGLVITQRLVQEMGGALTVDSEPGAGTQVHVDMLPGRD